MLRLIILIGLLIVVGLIGWLLYQLISGKSQSKNLRQDVKRGEAAKKTIAELNEEINKPKK